MTRARDLSNLANQNVLSVDNSSLDVGISSASPDSDLNVGSSIKMDGPSGIITATSFSGDGANLTGISSLGEQGYLKQLKVSGVVTATSFAGDGSALTGVANTDYVVGTALTMVSVKVSGSATVDGQLSVGGTITYEDVTNVDSVGIVTGRLGLRASGGGLNVVGVSTLAGATETRDIKVGIGYSINVAIDKHDTVKIQQRSVGVGSTDTSGRDAGIGTAQGTLVYNTSIANGTLQVYNGAPGWANVSAVPITVTGGTASPTSRADFIVHTFNANGSLIIEGGQLENVEIYMAGGGGGGGSEKYGAGGGAGGGYFANSWTLPANTYPVTVGPGGAGGSSPGNGTSGSNTTFDTPTSSFRRTATGGGGGAGNYAVGTSGGCGGGASAHSGSGAGEGTQPTSNPGVSPAGTNYGYDGGLYPCPLTGYAAAGGGGQGGPGGNADAGAPQACWNGGGNGGPGQPISITGSAVVYGGGGSSSVYNGSNPMPNSADGCGGNGGGGSANPDQHGDDGSSPGATGVANRGAGGAGTHADHSPPQQPANTTPYANGHAGGSGVVIIAYPTAQASPVTGSPS